MKNEQKEQELKFKEVYLDANLFVYAAISTEQQGESARKMLEEIERGNYEAYTAALTFDEILWAITKHNDKETAYKAAERFLSLPHLTLIEINTSLVQSFIEIYKNEKLKPRDALHLAAMQSQNIKTMISSDADFDIIKGIKRMDFTKR